MNNFEKFWLNGLFHNNLVTSVQRGRARAFASADDKFLMASLYSLLRIGMFILALYKSENIQ